MIDVDFLAVDAERKPVVLAGHCGLVPTARLIARRASTGDNAPGTGGKFPETVADMELALRYIEEFVAQSDVYPLTDE